MFLDPSRWMSLLYHHSSSQPHHCPVMEHIGGGYLEEGVRWSTPCLTVQSIPQQLREKWWHVALHCTVCHFVKVVEEDTRLTRWVFCKRSTGLPTCQWQSCTTHQTSHKQIDATAKCYNSLIQLLVSFSFLMFQYLLNIWTLLFCSFKQL